MKTSTSRRVRAAAASAALLFLTVWTVEPGSSPVAAAAQSPPERAPAGPVVHVSTEADLQNAVARITSGTTIVIAPGTYRLTSTLSISGAFSDVTIKGATENANDVALVGRGMANANHGGVLHGIVLDGRLQRVTIANLAIREVAQHAILVNAGSSAPRIHNVHLLNAGRQFIKANADGRGRGVVDGVIEYSVMEYSATALDSDTGGIDVAAGSGWVVRHNLFRNIEAPSGGLAGPAVLMWQASRDSIVDGNVFINCQREIAFGLEDRSRLDHLGGIIRNNVIYRDAMIQGHTAILVADSPKTQVLHNTILANNTYSTLIEYRFRDTAEIAVRNNLLDGQIMARDGATGTSRDNYTQAHAGLFVNAAAGDLHLGAGALAVLDQVSVLREAAADFDGQARQQGGLADYGADEYIGAPAPHTMPPPPPTRAVTATPTAPATTASKTITSAASTIEPATTPADGTLPSPWDSLDIGSALPGSASFWSDIFIVRGGGSDIGEHADQFRFVYQVLEGDGEIVARVDTLDKLHPWTKGGVMIRNELTAGSKYAAALVTARKGLVFQRRIANDATTTLSNGGSGGAPYWVKLVRSGDTFTAYRSRDGVKWAVMGSEVVYLNRTAYVGMAVTSRSTRALATAGFREVTVVSSGGSPNQPPAVRIDTPAPGSVYSSPATVEVGATASDADGSVTRVDFYSGSTAIGSAGSSPFSVKWANAPSGRHVLKAVAHDNKGAATSSAAVEVEVTTPSNQAPSVSLTAPANNSSYTAPATIELKALAADSDGTIARVDFYSGSTQIGSATSSPYGSMWGNVPAGTYTLKAIARDNSGGTAASAAVTIAVGGAANKPPTVGLTEPSSGAKYTAPASITMNATAADPDGKVAKVEFYAGSRLVGSASSSPFSATWTDAPAGTHSLAARAWDNAGASVMSPAVSVTVEEAPAPGLPAGWSSRDVGNPAVAGSASYGSGAFTVSGAGTDIWNAGDQFRFVYQPFDGNGAIAACVTSVDFVDEWTKAGVMFRESLTGESPHAFTLLSAGRGADFQYRLEPGGASTQQGPEAAVAPHCIRLVRKGNTFTASHSADGTTWTLLGTQTIAMSASAYVGLAVTSRNTGTAATARFDRVAISQAAPNEPPVVSLTVPASVAPYTAPASITLDATASDPDGSVTKVDFYAGAALVGSDATSPFSATWSGAPAGTHSLTAVAWDDSGASTTSNAVSVTVKSNQPPVVSLTAPAAGAKFTAPATVTFSASASDPDGSVAVVEFHASGVRLGSDTTNSYSIAISGMPEGTYSVTAVARDNAGVTTTSAPVSITIEPAAQPLPRMIGFQASPDHNTSVTFYAVEVFRAGANPSTTAPFRAQNAGKPTPVSGEITVNVDATMQALPAGTYFVTVSATGSGGTSRSAPSETFVR